MLGIIIIAAIGNFFYRLAREFEKNVWLFAILGIVCYYACTLLTGFVIGVVIALNGGEVTDSEALGYGLMAIPFGLLGCVLFYFLLKRAWSKQKAERLDTLDNEELTKL